MNKIEFRLNDRLTVLLFFFFLRLHVWKKIIFFPYFLFSIIYVKVKIHVNIAHSLVYQKFFLIRFHVRFIFAIQLCV